MKKNLVLLITVSAIIYIFFVHAGIATISNNIVPLSLSSDAEINYLTAVSMYRGEGWYEGFNNVYPPGRFILQAGLFRFLSPSVPTSTLYFNTFVFFFSVALFFLCLKLFPYLTSKKYLPYLLATISTLLYLFFIQSAQEVHTVTSLFFIILLTKFKDTHRKQILLGAILGCVFLFRIDAGILLVLSILVFLRFDRADIRNWTLGFLFIWGPILFILVFHGSLTNFIYDTVYYALIEQPKQLGLSLPAGPIGLLYYSICIFILSSSLSLAVHAKKLSDEIRFPIQSFSLFSVLSFTAALGRSDEGHLWYGAIWVGLYCGYVLLLTLQAKFILKKLIIQTILLIPVFLLLGYLLIGYKQFIVFILVSLGVFLISKKIPKNYAVSILFAGLIASLIYFHSISFLRIRIFAPQPSLRPYPPFNTFVSGQGELAGLRLNNTTLKTLEAIQNALDPTSRWLFIYPDHALLYESFTLINPTRHDYQLSPTTQKVQEEIITDLERSGINNFIIFPESIQDKRSVWHWIQKNTTIDSIFILDDANVEVRKRKKL